MRHYFVSILLLTCSANACALESLRIGSQLLVVGDAAAKVKALMGKPDVHVQGNAARGAHKISVPSVGASRKQAAKEKGEKWQYRRDGHITIFTMASGRITHIEDWPQ